MKGLRDVNIESPSPLQKKIFKAVQTGSDLVINTTSEQTPELGYLISLLNTISKSERRQGTRAIILTSSEERAKQIDEWIWAIGYHSSIESACYTDENDIKKQQASLSAGPVIVISTPQQLANILQNGRMIFREVDQLIVDQAEQITDWDSVDVISKRVIAPKCQRIFTASKDSKGMRDAEKRLLNEPELVEIEKKTPPKKELEKDIKSEAITKDLTQYYINVPPRSKISTLMAHLDDNKSDTVVIFAASRRTADRLYKILRKSGRRAVSIHDKVDEKTYNQRFQMFTDGSVQHLIIGQLSAKDIPLEHATQVINYDVPEDVDEYKLRAELIGDGKATRILSLVSKQDRGDIRTISESLGYAPEEVPLPKSVKEKAKTEKKQPKKSKTPKKQSKAKPSPKSKQSRGKASRSGRSSKKKEKGYKGLPRPSYDGLSGGRSGKKEEKKGITGFFKKLFS
ncbi:MAG: DEAD/DEAH box helicase [Balneolaceae bacterium]